MQTENCDPITAIIPCDDPPVGGPIPTGPGVDLGTACNVWNYTVVTPETDWDQDGMKDACEAELAMAFEPKLVLHSQEMYAGREPYWTVQRVGPQVYVGYLFAYYYDAPPWEHHGDSEWVIVTLRQDSLYRWALDFVKLSAHWGSSIGDETRWVGAPDLLFVGPAPVVFVSKDHHGNYESEQRCDARIGDECSPFGIQVAPLGIVSSRNIGNSLRRFDLDPALGGSPDCTSSKGSAPGSYAWLPRSGFECFMSTAEKSTFAGWNGPNAGTTHYSAFLQAHLLW